MIYGIGTDIVDINRIKGLQNLDEFCKKLLSENELEIFKTTYLDCNLYYKHYTINLYSRILVINNQIINYGTTNPGN